MQDFAPNTQAPAVKVASRDGRPPLKIPGYGPVGISVLVTRQIGKNIDI